MFKQSSFELILGPIMIFINPIMSYCTDQYRHDHWILLHYFNVLFFKQIKREVI